MENKNSINLAPDETGKSVRLTVRLTPDEPIDADSIPPGYKKTVALIKDPDAKKKGAGAGRQKKLELAKKDAGLVRCWVPESVIDLAEKIGWVELERRAKRRSVFGLFFR